MMDGMTWTLTIRNRVDNVVTSTVTLSDEGKVTTTGLGDLGVPITVFDFYHPPHRILTPADGLPWFIVGRGTGTNGLPDHHHRRPEGTGLGAHPPTGSLGAHVSTDRLTGFG
jgi:hypothetical protein